MVGEAIKGKLVPLHQPWEAIGWVTRKGMFGWNKRFLHISCHCSIECYAGLDNFRKYINSFYVQKIQRPYTRDQSISAVTPVYLVLTTMVSLYLTPFRPRFYGKMDSLRNSRGQRFAGFNGKENKVDCAVVYARMSTHPEKTAGEFELVVGEEVIRLRTSGTFLGYETLRSLNRPFRKLELAG